jgi:hypothetical protein
MHSTPNALDRLYADRIEHVERKRDTEVFFLSVEAFPELNPSDFSSTGGAYVHCYIDADDLRAAEQRMLSLLQERGWRPHRLEGWEITSPERADKTVNDDGVMSQFDLVHEALEEEYALVFYRWDSDAREPLEEEQWVARGRQ